MPYMGVILRAHPVRGVDRVIRVLSTEVCVCLLNRVVMGRCVTT